MILVAPIKFNKQKIKQHTSAYSTDITPVIWYVV